MTKRADKVQIGDRLAEYGEVTFARKSLKTKAPVSFAGAKRPRKTVCPPFTPVVVVELRTDGHPVPLYHWPADTLELAA